MRFKVLMCRLCLAGNHCLDFRAHLQVQRLECRARPRCKARAGQCRRCCNACQHVLADSSEEQLQGGCPSALGVTRLYSANLANQDSENMIDILGTITRCKCMQRCSHLHLCSASGWHCCRGPITRPKVTRVAAAAGGSPRANSGGTFSAAVSASSPCRKAYKASFAAGDGCVSALHRETNE